jgi:hypothetical protein
MFKDNWDLTTIDQQKKMVEIHRPDGKPDILQQIEHGLITIIGGYKNLGRLYRGIICPTLRQYVLLGDGSTMTDGVIYNPLQDAPEETKPIKLDDRWEFVKNDDRLVFTEDEPDRELEVVEALAVAARVMRGYNDTLGTQALLTAEDLYSGVSINEIEEIRQAGARVESGLYGFRVDDRRYERTLVCKIRAAAELLVTTGNRQYKEDLIKLLNDQAIGNSDVIAYLGKVLPLIGNKQLTTKITEAARKYRMEIDRYEKESPYSVPFPHRIGSSWGLQSHSMKQYQLFKAFPDIFDGKGVILALNAVLGFHPGENAMSLVSGVGSKSAVVAYGFNRADGSYVPGGTIKGPVILKPAVPELKIWPYLWQESEYVIDAQNTGGAVHFMFLVMAAMDILNHQ